MTPTLSEPQRHNRRRRFPLLTLLLGLAAACGGDTTAPSPRVVPVAIVAAPATDTVLLGDSVVLSVTADSGAQPDHVLWQVIVPTDTAPDTTTRDTLVFHPRAAGSVIVRAEAAFTDGASGSAERAFYTPRGTIPAAPSIVIRPVDNRDAQRVPLGDTIALFVDALDSQAVVPQGVRWYLAKGQKYLDSLLFIGDTLRVVADSLRTWRFTAVVTDTPGAATIATYASSAYDPIIPAAWRTPVGAAMLSYHPDGFVVAHNGVHVDGSGQVCGCTLTALDLDGHVLWVDTTTDAGAPLVVGDRGGIYLGTGSLLRFGADGHLAWNGGGAIFGPVVLPGGRLAVVDSPGGFLAAYRLLRIVTPGGSETWRDSLPMIRQASSLAVGGDSTIYVYGRASAAGPPDVLVAVRADSGVRWQLVLGSGDLTVGGMPFVVPANDSTLLVLADSLYAIDTNGTRRWASSEASALYASSPVVDSTRLYLSDHNHTKALSLEDGSILWSLSTGAAPGVLSADGRLFASSGHWVLGLDATTGAEVWRHQLAGAARALLLTDGGVLVMSDGAYVEGVEVGSGPASSPWPMPWGDPQRTGRMQKP